MNAGDLKIIVFIGGGRARARGYLGQPGGEIRRLESQKCLDGGKETVRKSDTILAAVAIIFAFEEETVEAIAAAEVEC